MDAAALWLDRILRQVSAAPQLALLPWALSLLHVQNGTVVRVSK